MKHSIFVILLILSCFALTLNAFNCSGGSIIKSERYGGFSPDYAISAIVDYTGKLIVGGYKLSETSFPVDDKWTNATVWNDTQMGSSPWIAFSSLNSTSRYTWEWGGDDMDHMIAMDATAKYICAVGKSLSSVNTWPTLAISPFTTTNQSLTNAWVSCFDNVGDGRDWARGVRIAGDTVSVAGDTTSWYLRGYDTGNMDIFFIAFDVTYGSAKTFFVWLESYGTQEQVYAIDKNKDKGPIAIVGSTTANNASILFSAAALANAAQTFINASLGIPNGYIVVVNSSTAQELYATLFGGSDVDVITDVRYDDLGYIYVAGYTASTDLPKAGNGLWTSLVNDTDGFLAVFSPAGNLVHSTYIGGSGHEDTANLDVITLADGSHLVYIAINTNSTDMPMMEEFKNTTQGDNEVYLIAIELKPCYNAAKFKFGSYFGTNGTDTVSEIKAQPDGTVIIAGATDGSNFPGSGFNSVNTDGYYAALSCPAMLNPAAVICPSPSPSPSVTPTVTPSISASPSVTPSVTPTASATPTVTPTVTPTASVTPTVTPTASVTPTVTPTASVTPSLSPSPSVTPTVTPSISTSPSVTPSASPSSSPYVCMESDGCYVCNEVSVRFDNIDGQYGPDNTMNPINSHGIILWENLLRVQHLSLEERDKNGNTVKMANFPKTGYNVSVTEKIARDGVLSKTITFEQNLTNGAHIKIENYLVHYKYSFDFYGLPIPVEGSSNKATYEIRGWNFTDISHTLHVFLQIQMVPEPINETVKEISSYVSRHDYTTNETYARVVMVGLANVDDLFRPISYNINSSSIELIFPSFTRFLQYDPDYTVLVTEDSQSSSQSKEPTVPWWAYFITCLVVIGIATAIGAVWLRRVLIRRATLRMETRKRMSAIGLFQADSVRSSSRPPSDFVNSNPFFEQRAGVTVNPLYDQEAVFG